VSLTDLLVLHKYHAPNILNSIIRATLKELYNYACVTAHLTINVREGRCVCVCVCVRAAG